MAEEKIAPSPATRSKKTRSKAAEPSYSAAVAELEAIISDLRADTTDVDTLTAKVKRATELLHICRGKLTTTDHDLRQALENLSDTGI